jgi:type IV pilus assembly protein PilC
MQEPENREKRDKLALRIPVFGDLARQKALASFVRSLRKLFAAGLGPITAWEGAMNVAPNVVIRDKLIEAHGMMQKSVALHDAFTATGLFANETEQLLATGVVSGQMVQMLDRVAEYYQDNVDRAYSSARFWMFRLAFTMCIILVGALVIMLMSSYFSSVFKWVDDFLPEASS